MLQFPIHGWTQVIEISVARELFYRLGCGMRRIDGEKLDVFKNPGELGFYVAPEAPENPLLTRLAVDEGIWTGAIQRVTADGGDVPESILSSDGISRPWNEYVDFVDVLRACVNKLAPEAEIKECTMLGRGSRAQHFREEFVRVLEVWSLLNKDAIADRVATQTLIKDLIDNDPSGMSEELAVAKAKLAAFPYLPRVEFV